MRPTEFRDLMLNNGWLKAVPDDFAYAVLDKSRVLDLDVDVELYKIGGKPKGLYGFVSGVVGFSAGPNEKRPVDIHTLRSVGDWFGEYSFLTQTPSLARAKTIQPSKLLLINAEDLHELLAQKPQYWRWVGVLMA